MDQNVFVANNINQIDN
ncbi:unnamed protein product [Spodoptera littoralis]|uniref:Uncharacterized protein n=1 Tax=Spodoptera littoralis TaxID=7109 RepID=A0A9P0IG80_SPOLI|nr:unnamed protein product [Spodoptera littoralis]CAH1647205.1 unnamed protein product [Spodoptera littoralis]